MTDLHEAAEAIRREDNMKHVMVLEAGDGSQFKTREECEHYEQVCADVATAEAMLPPCTVQGESFMQLDRDKVLAFQRVLVRIFIREHPGLVDGHVTWALEANRPAGDTLIGRYISDCGPAVLNRAWWRIMCIDDGFRQWSQPYYVARQRGHGGHARSV